MAESDFMALPGFYKALFLYIEPISTISPALMVWIYPGAKWFYHELIPSSASALPLEPKSSMAILQLTNCYFLLGLISSLVFRAIRDALPHDPASQERILGAAFVALALADVSRCISTSGLWCIVVTFLGLPKELQYNLAAWNPMTHGNISIVVVLLSVRIAWFLGIGRTRYYYGKRSQTKLAKKS
ncbi:hypothetical protein PILCRDRAFT_96812 [Piloderma croceum F 1598]|uniref:DUF7704 domain-containing protein n=1 Tax=Piloderma croceum (strain F 1598) TaxID=765440 RepID=A0A0C3BEL2_PILCF|nr:hypothetical protein PILCRDRAFT_96812 [Piloderma croceum F 1598]